MEPKAGIVVVIMVLASLAVIPAALADAEDSDVFRYYSQLDANGQAVYNSVSSATSVADTTIHFDVGFEEKDLCLFNESGDAESYAKAIVRDALATVYLSCPAVPYIWNYPVSGVAVDVHLETRTVSESGSMYYAVTGVTFPLSVPDGITADSMKKLDDAVKTIKVTGNTDSEKVQSILSYLNRVVYQKDAEGTVSNMYGALVEKKSTSAGIAQAFNHLCAINGIKSVAVTGVSHLAKEETLNVWNEVYLKGDLDGKSVYQWFIVDPTYAVEMGIVGYMTDVAVDGITHSASAWYKVDLDVIGDNTLSSPEVAEGKYVREGGPSFIELYGEVILMTVIVVIVVAALLYAAKLNK